MARQRQQEMIEKSLAHDKRPPGRPRSLECHDAILQSALTLLEEVGFADLTIEGIAARAGCGKTSIYRRWPNKASLVMDAFLVSTAPEIEFHGAGSVREDFCRQLRAVVRVLTSQRGRLIATLIGGAQGDPELKEAYRTRWQSKRRAESLRMLQLAINRGEVRKNIDCELVLDALYGPLYYRLLINHAPLTASYAEELVDVVLSGIQE